MTRLFNRGNTEYERALKKNTIKFDLINIIEMNIPIRIFMVFRLLPIKM